METVLEAELTPPPQPAPQPWNLRGLSVIAFAHGVSDFYGGIIPITIFLVLSRQHISPAYQGVLVFLWYLTSSIIQPFFGAYTDRHGRWWFMPTALACVMTSVSIAATVNSMWLLALLIIVGGVGSAVLHPEGGKYSAMLSGSRRATGISIFQIGGQLGYSLGPVAIALLYARLGAGGSLWLLVPGTLGIVAIFTVMRGVARSAVQVHGAAQTAAASNGSVDRVGVGLIMASTAIRHFTSGAFIAFLPNLLVARGFSIPAFGEVVTAFLLVSTFGLFAGGYLSDRYGPVRISIGALCGAVPFLFGFFAIPGPLGILSLLIASVLLAVQNAPGVSIVQAMLPRNLGMALGLMNGVAFGAGSAAVAGIGIVVAQLGAATALESVSVMPLVAALAYVLVGNRLPSLRARPAPG
jgi:FSR family fosmidomycin resistance protein-like MFS transporter